MDLAEVFLVDWDVVPHSNTSQATTARCAVGTWQFMSIVSLQYDENHQYDAEDDLESFLWAFCYCLVRYTNLYPGDNAMARAFLQDVFDYSRNVVKDDKAKTHYQNGGQLKEVLLSRMRNGKSVELQPQGLAKPLRSLLRIVGKSLLYHVNMRHLERWIRPSIYNPPTDDLGEEELEDLQEQLEQHKAAAVPDQAFGYVWLKSVLEGAIEGMRKFELPALSTLSGSPPRGSVRVEDRFETEKRGATPSKPTAEKEEEREKKRTSRGGLKRGSTSTSEKPASKQRPVKVALAAASHTARITPRESASVER
ncbi:unnamed protein product [Peniophora sp. CBMAI 1063]|nr:unnamed protein product [Peniophora sp. CBMAI 1063]